jgi:carbamoyltransferase
MIALGINAASHGSAAALVRDGQRIAAAEEERFARIQHGKRPLPFTAWERPCHAIGHGLAEAGLTLAQVDHVAYRCDPQRFIRGRLAQEAAPAALAPTHAAEMPVTSFAIPYLAVYWRFVGAWRFRVLFI